MIEIKGAISTNITKEAAKIAGEKHSLEEHMKAICKCNAKFMDIKVSRNFKSKKLIVSAIKCAHSFNYYRVRDALINKKIGDKCQRWN